MNPLLSSRVSPSVFTPISGGRVPLILPATALGPSSGSAGTFSLGSGPVLDANGIDSSIYCTFSTFTGGNGDHFVRWTSVPEPSAALLGSIGLIALLRRRSATRSGR